MKLTVVLGPSDEDGFVVYVPSLPGCVSEGDTEDRRPLGDLIQEALVKTLAKQAVTPEERKIAYHLFCEQPMKISADQLRYVLDNDVSGC